MFVKIYKNDGKKIEYDHVVNLRDKMASLSKDNNELKRYLFIKYPLVPADIIVSNPPYVDKSEPLERMVKDFEPNNALIPPSGNGLEFYQRFFISLSSYLKDGGYFIAEFGTNQKDDILNMASSLLPNSNITFYKDISGKDRFFVLQYFRLK